jgi:hypothetical protein
MVEEIVDSKGWAEINYMVILRFKERLASGYQKPTYK